MRRYSIDEIRTYMLGCMYLGDDEEMTKRNLCLSQAIIDLDDQEDGIEAVVERRQSHEQAAEQGGA